MDNNIKVGDCVRTYIGIGIVSKIIRTSDQTVTYGVILTNRGRLFRFYKNVKKITEEEYILAMLSTN